MYARIEWENTHLTSCWLPLCLCLSHCVAFEWEKSGRCNRRWGVTYFLYFFFVYFNHPRSISPSLLASALFTLCKHLLWPILLTSIYNLKTILISLLPCSLFFHNKTTINEHWWKKIVQKTLYKEIIICCWTFGHTTFAAITGHNLSIAFDRCHWIYILAKQFVNTSNWNDGNLWIRTWLQRSIIQIGNMLNVNKFEMTWLFKPYTNIVLKNWNR